MTTDVLAYRISLAVLFLSWMGLGAAILLRNRAAGAAPAAPPAGNVVQRNPMARAGLLLQAAGFAIVWAVRRPLDTPYAMWDRSLWITSFTVAVLSAASFWLTSRAVAVLGRHWSIDARLLPDHAIVTDGPFAVMRHPIYTALGGMLLATGVALGRPVATLAGITLYAVGTSIRASGEERLLRDRFGASWERYAASVPRFLPRPGRR